MRGGRDGAKCLFTRQHGKRTGQCGLHSMRRWQLPAGTQCDKLLAMRGWLGVSCGLGIAAAMRLGKLFKCY